MKVKLSQFSQNKNQILRFDANARIEIFIDNHDIESESDFESIMESNISDDEKVIKLKEIALRIANERIDNIGDVKISADLSIGSINIDSIDWIYMFERYQEDKQMMADYHNKPTAVTKTKIKLSQKQWHDIGKKAGWIKQAASTLTNDEVDAWIDMEGATLKQKINEPREYKEIYVNDDKTRTLEVTYEKFWEMKAERGAGYGFPCNPDGKLTVKPSSDAVEAIKSNNYKDPIIVKTGHEIRSGCNCGSGLSPYMEYDARGIELGYMCDKCKKDKLSKFRPDVLKDPQYWSDEPIEPEE